MILTCPRCATRYLIDDGQLWATGRDVRCEACGRQWRAVGEARPAPMPVPTPAKDIAKPEPVAEPEPEPVAEPVPRAAPAWEPSPWRPPVAESASAPPLVKEPAAPEPSPVSALSKARQARRRPTPRRRAPLALWVILGLSLLAAAGAWAAIVFRDAIIAEDPAMSPVYDKIGLGSGRPPAGPASARPRRAAPRG